MSPSVGTKSIKKQPASSAPDTTTAEDREIEQALLLLENACLKILEESETAAPNDMESRTWHERFENIAMPVSMALVECKGPRHFHYHYRRREDDESVLRPVMDNPVDQLAQVCTTALRHCQEDLQGMHDPAITALRAGLESALRGFLACHQKWRQ